MATIDDRIFTARFFVMCGFSFTVFCSVFCLIPTMPYRILSIGGTESIAGSFLGVLTYASALSAPLTGALADRAGKRRILTTTSLVIGLFSTTYTFVIDTRVLLALAAIHGIFWSALLSASSAYMLDIIPPARRAEGLGYWGLASTFALAVAPAIGFRLQQLGWTVVCGTVVALNLGMAAISTQLRHEQPPDTNGSRGVEWHVLLVSGCLFMVSLGYGAITSFVALFADHNHVVPRSIFFTTFAITMVCTRPWLGPLADRIGPRRVLVPCLLLVVVGEVLLARSQTRWAMIVAAIVFGTGFGSAWPVFAAYVMQHVGNNRRGAAFGSMLAMFDTGIGTGSLAAGWIVEHRGFVATWSTAAALAALAVPWFLAFDRWLMRGLEEANA